MPGAPSILRSVQNGWETYAVVADPETGKSVRVYHRAPLQGTDAAGLGRLIAHKLNEAGAGPLLAAAGGLR